jgi:hypothetical protein
MSRPQHAKPNGPRSVIFLLIAVAGFAIALVISFTGWRI